MPSLTFKDIILLVKNAYICVAKAKICTPDGKFFLILNETDWLESTFSVVQTMVGNNTNADILTLSHRLSHAVECLNILSEHPAWDCSPRQLHLHGIKDSNSDVCSKCDHITPESWEGDVNVQNVSLVTVWNLGHHTLTSEFLAINIEEALLKLESKGYDMEFPFSQLTKDREASNNEGNDTSVTQASQTLSPQDTTTFISLLKPGEGGYCILNFGQATHLD